MFFHLYGALFGQLINWEKSNANFIKGIEAEGRIIKVYLRCEKYYDEVKVLPYNKGKKIIIDLEEQEKANK